MSNQKLKIGLFVDSYNLPLWVYKMIEEINHSNHSEISLVIRREQKSIDKNSLINRLWKNRNKILFNFYSKFERKFFRKDFNPFEIKNLHDIIDCEEIKILPKEALHTSVLENQDVIKIKAKKIDVLIKIDTNSLQGDIDNLAKYGVWSYQYGGNNNDRDSLAGAWEVFNKEHDTCVILQIQKENQDDNIILYEAFYNTDHLFINRNRNNLYWNSKSILPRKLNELFTSGEEIFFQKTDSSNYEIKNREAPNNFETFKALVKLYTMALKKIIKRKFYFEQWILLFRMDEIENSTKSFNKFKRILPPKDRFWADPFIIQKNDSYYIFIEELIYCENKGKISFIEMDKLGNYKQPVGVLENDYHLSYPFLIEDDNKLYMLPETNQNKTIELYKCIDFPHKWELSEVLMKNIKAVDSTIFKFNNKFWLFTNIEEYSGFSNMNELHLFHSNSLLNGNWISHPQNPITTNHNYSRPAGNIFIKNDRIFRPAQNCSKHYGYGMNIREIITLNETEYKEIQVKSIYPNWEKDLISTHTINSNGKLTFIDAMISRKR